jgi:hypothetical protein
LQVDLQHLWYFLDVDELQNDVACGRIAPT